MSSALSQSIRRKIVGRRHGTLVRWIEPKRCSNFEVCQEHAVWAVETQRERYPALEGQSRVQAFPELLTNARRYLVNEETSHWEMQRVVSYLGQFVFRRKVEAKGLVTLFSNTYSAGRTYRPLEVEVQLDTDRYEWVFRDTKGKGIAPHPKL